MEPSQNPISTKRRALVWAGFTLLLIINLALGALLVRSRRQLRLVRMGESPASHEPVLTSDDLANIYSELACPCCGLDIGSCTCGMAMERQGAVKALVARESTSGQLYRAMYVLYGEGIFFDQELAEQVQTELEQSLPADRPILVAVQEQIDLGSVPIDGGMVSASYELRNDGESDLVITGLQTSCGCTTAVLEWGEETSPVFGASPPEGSESWSAVIPPGGQARVVATYDPLFHGDTGIGSFLREISVLSNDPLNPRLQLVLAVEVTE